MRKYVSPYGPKMRPALNIAGIPLKSLGPLTLTAAAFGGVALGTVIYYAEGVPRVQRDILQKFPILGAYWTGREVPASDNPF